jgi:methylated-DNA-[protein]-cysteine S-methyltransferase
MNADDLARDLARAFPGTPGDLRRLHDRLAAAAERDGILDVAYRTVDSPVGPLLLAATEAGLVRVAYASEGYDTVLQALADRISPRILGAPARLDAPARELDEYFTGRRRNFDLPLDWRLSAGFRRAVLSHLPEIGYGHTASYAAVANLAGPPKAVRAAATACAAPTPSAPCSPWRPPHEPHRNRDSEDPGHRRHWPRRDVAGPGRGRRLGQYPR